VEECRLPEEDDFEPNEEPESASIGPQNVLSIGPQNVLSIGPQNVLSIGPQNVLSIGPQNVQTDIWAEEITFPSLRQFVSSKLREVMSVRKCAENRRGTKPVKAYFSACREREEGHRGGTGYTKQLPDLCSVV
jgi:hypothetical protein